MKPYVSHRRFALVALAGVVALAGCALFNRPEPTFPPPPPIPTPGPSVPVPVTGGVVPESGTLVEQVSVPATGGVTLPTLNVTTPTGETTTLTNVVIPSTTGQPQTLPARTPVAIIRKEQQILVGTFTQGAPVTINGQTNSGVTLNSDGTPTTHVALPVDPVRGTRYRIELPPAEFVVPTRAARQQQPTTGKIRVEQTVFEGVWRAQGTQVVGGVTVAYAVTGPVPQKIVGEIANPFGIVVVGFDRDCANQPCYLLMRYQSAGAAVRLQQRQVIPPATSPGLTAATVAGYPFAETVNWLLSPPYPDMFKYLLTVAFQKLSAAHGWPDNDTVAQVWMSVGLVPEGWVE